MRYKGEQLDGEATLRLLEAFNEFRNYGVVPGQPNVTYFAESKPSASIDRVEWLQDAKEVALPWPACRTVEAIDLPPPSHGLTYHSSFNPN